MRRLCRLHLLTLLDLRSSPTVLPSPISTPVETKAGPSKVIGAFSTTRLSGRLKEAVYTSYPAVSSGTSNSMTALIPSHFGDYFWWTWRESNPRPEVLLFEGITTISLLYHNYELLYTNHIT